MNSIIAIAKTVIKEIIRMRVLMLFIGLFLLGFTWFFGMWLGVGSGRPDEKVQTFISYSVSGIVVLLSFTTMFLTVSTVTRDIKRCEIFTIATKPVSRFGYLAGKFLGITVFNFIVLLIAFGLVYFTANRIADKEVAKLSGEEQAYFRDRIDSLVLSSRQNISPELPSFDQQVKAEVERMLEDQISRYPELKKEPALIEEMRQTLTAEAEGNIRKGFLTVAVGEYKIFEFSNIKVLPGQEFVYLRYNMEVSMNTQDLKAYGLWLIGPEDPSISKTGSMLQTHDTIRTPHEHKIPANLVSPEGKLFIAYRNPYDNMYSSILFSEKNGLEILYTASTYFTNFGRAFILIMFRLIFLAIVSLSFGALLSFPVAVLAVMVVFIIGVCSGFIFDAVDSNMGNVSGSVLQTIMLLFPQLAKYDPSYMLEKGRHIDSLLVADCLLKMVMLNGGIAGVIGLLLFRKRELARVVV